MSLLVSVVLAAGWTLPAITPGAAHRSATPRACAPFRSDENYDYYRRKKELTVTLEKPIGAALDDASEGGVKVAEVMEGGSAATTGLLKVGDQLLSVSGTDVSAASLDLVMETLGGAPSPVDIAVARTVIVREVKTKPFLDIVGGNSGECERGVILRTAIQSSKSELYRGMAKVTNCGGVGNCLTCQVEVLEGMDNLSPKTAAEEKMLKKRPANYRLACQVIVNGNAKVKVP